MVPMPLHAGGGPTADALLATSAHPSLGAAADLYAWLVGSWNVDVTDFGDDGMPRHGDGEWHFAWVLEGRALQDVWIVPMRAERAREPASVVGNRYGTSLRVYDRETATWRVTWINPVTGAEDHLVGRREGEDVVQTGIDREGRLMRWTFTDITPDGFRWLGETSADDGASWRLDAEFVGRRRERSAPPWAATWRWTDRPGLEALQVRRDGAEVIAESEIVMELEGASSRVHYRLRYDASWALLEGTIAIDRAGATRSMEIRQVEPGVWSVDGRRRKDLDGCTDLDLMTTPFTNTPPLLRLEPAAGDTVQLRVAWVRFPDLSVTPVDQEYTRLDDSGLGRRYRYRNMESGFVDDLELDARRLVVSYGPWRLLEHR
jgi:hypothetical protein